MLLTESAKLACHRIGSEIVQGLGLPIDPDFVFRALEGEINGRFAGTLQNYKGGWTLLALALGGGNYRRLGGLGLVTIGSGGSASDYSFDPVTGLSNDPRLAFDLQSLTPAQLQTALTNPSGVTGDLLSLLNQAATGTGAGVLPCGSAGSSDPNCMGGLPLGMSATAWGTWFLIGGGLLLLWNFAAKR